MVLQGIIPQELRTNSFKCVSNGCISTNKLKAIMAANLKYGGHFGF